jgi:hypothetical protein
MEQFVQGPGPGGSRLCPGSEGLEQLEGQRERKLCHKRDLSADPSLDFVFF